MQTVTEFLQKVINTIFNVNIASISVSLIVTLVIALLLARLLIRMVI